MEYYTHDIDPTLIKVGFIQIRYYGLMYLTGFIAAFYYFRFRYRRGWFSLNSEEVQDLFTYHMLGMMIGARLAYVFIYNWEQYQNNLLEIFYIWQGGLSFHGAAVGFIIAMLLYSRKYSIGFWHLADHVATVSSLGVFFGRIGNFTNGELWGRPTDVPWAVIFPAAGAQPRHPSQLYQSLIEGLAVFLILILIDWRERKKYLHVNETKNKFNVSWERTGIVASSWLILYGTGRFIIEYFREPDPQLGYYLGHFSMGQILCSIMIVAGMYLLLINIRNKKPETYSIPNS